MTTAYTEVPRIYVASLADYNAGRLVGAWIDADQDAGLIMDEINAMLATSDEPIAEEWAIHDTDNFYGVRIDEYETIERVADIANAIAEHGPAFAAFSDYTGNSDVDEFTEAYQGEYADEEAFAESTVDEGLWGEISYHLAPYIDYEKMARDLFMGDYFSARADGGNVYIFRSY